MLDGEYFKEWDEETGNYYYGARYYDPKISVWLSVDPLAHKFPGWSSYNFTMNNPLNLVDPDGMAAGDPGKTRTHTIGENDTYYHLANVTYKDDPTITVENLRKWNPGIDENDLQFDQIINISDPNASSDSEESDSNSSENSQNQEGNEDNSLDNEWLTTRNYPTLEEWAETNNRDLQNEVKESLGYGSATSSISSFILTGKWSFVGVLIGTGLSGLATSFDILTDYDDSLTPEQKKVMSERLKQIQERYPSKYGE